MVLIIIFGGCVLPKKIKLNKQQTSVPFLLSQLNIEMAKAIQHDSSELSLKQKDIIKKITSLSNIRYGY